MIYDLTNFEVVGIEKNDKRSKQVRSVEEVDLSS